MDERTWERLGKVAIGIQLSLNQSKDYSGSNTASWIWDTRRAYPFLYRPGEPILYGYTLSEARSRNFQIERERWGASARFELRINDRHDFFFSASFNRFDDTETEQIFARRITGNAGEYAGTKWLTPEIVHQLGGDPDDPFNKNRIGVFNLNASLTFNEAIALGELAYDPVTKIFTTGGIWAMPMDRTFIHTFREDRINTYQTGGKHRLPWDLQFDWKYYGSKATQDSVQNWLRFAIDGSSGRGAVPRAGIKNPFLQDLSENQVIYAKSSFFLRENLQGPPTGRQYNLLYSEDERTGYEANLKKRMELAGSTWTTQVGWALDKRSKEYAINSNSSGLLIGGLDSTQWPLGRMSLEDELFDGGELSEFERNFGADLRFGPSFHPQNTLAFLRDPGSYGAEFVQSVNQLNNNYITQVTTNYAATEDIMGLYFQQTIDWKRWTFIFGFRYEDTESTFTNLRILTRNPEHPNIPFINPTQWKIYSERFGDIFVTNETNRKSYDYLLPAFHAVRRVGENGVVRGSITQTIARPLFSDLIPREIPTISNSNFQPIVRLPAFDLRPMEATNYDLSFDYYIRPIGLLSMAVFYKDLDGPIYDEVRRDVGPDTETERYAILYNSRNAAINPDNVPPGATIVNNDSYDFYRKRNAGKGKLFGVEFTYDRKLNFLPGFWNGFGINSNIAWFDSEAKLLTDGRLYEKVRLFKQPDMTANFSLYYEKYGLFARLSYNLRGAYLDSITAGDDLLRDLGADKIDNPANSMDIHVDSTSRLDLTIRYNITAGLQVFLEVINLTNEPEFRYRGKRYRPMSREYNDRVATIGAKWNF